MDDELNEPAHAARVLLDLAQVLDQARSRIEERFVEGGQVLAAALQSAALMRDLLSDVLAALDGKAVTATVAGLADTVARLHDLPARQEAQHALVNTLATRAWGLQSRVGDLQETLRYLRTVAVAVKIAGAEAAEFDEFANDMLDRIQTGRAQVDGFAARLGLLLGQARAAASLHRGLHADQARAIPQLTRELDFSADSMTAYHARLRDLAATLDVLVRETEAQVGRTLGALQIGDMTRQRVEHVQAGLLLLAESASALPAGGVQPVLALLLRQLADLGSEFRHGGQEVSQGLSALSANMVQMLALGRQADGKEEGGDAFLPALEHGILAAQAIVARIEGATRRGDSVSRDAADVARDLTDAVGVITEIRSEIQFMAINTSLRCRRLGDAGRAIVVVATELRNFAARLEDEAAVLLGDLQALAEEIPPVDGEEAEPSPEVPLGAALEAALAMIRDTQRRMQRDLQMLTGQGEQLASDIGHGVARLDLARELGDALDGAETRLAALAEQGGPGIVPDTPAVARVIAEIRSNYTMARERDLHDAFIGQPIEIGQQKPVLISRAMSAAQDKEDDLAAVFF